MLTRLLLTTIIVLAPLVANAAEKRAEKGPEKTAGRSTSEWDHWYTVTILPKTPFAYYHEKLERKKGRLHFKTEMWKKEEGFINAEQLGVFSDDNAELSPLFYNFHATYRESEVSIDGSSSNGRLHVRIRRNNTELPVITRGLSSKAFFSSMFPIWMSRKLLGTPADQAKSTSFSFLAILEDNQDSGFSAESGRIQLVEPDEFAKSSGTIRVQVDFNGQRSSWYLDKSSSPVRVDIPGQKTRIERTDEKRAKAFLNST
jgi:hypothetical protein